MWWLWGGGRGTPPLYPIVAVVASVQHCTMRELVDRHLGLYRPWQHHYSCIIALAHLA